MEDQDRQQLASLESKLRALTARINALAEGNFEIGAEGFRIGSTRLLEKLVSAAYHLHQREADGTESDLTGAKSIQGVPIHDTAPTGGYVLVYNASTGQIEWTAASTPGAHVLATTAGLGASHTTSGLTAGQVLRATAAAAAAFQAIQDADLPSTIMRDTEHTAIGDASPHHAAVTIGADAAHSLAGQVLSAVLAAAAQVGHVGTGAQTFGGQKTFADGIKTDTIDEETATAGVTLDGSKVKDFLFYPDPVNNPNMKVGKVGSAFYFSYDAENLILYANNKWWLYVGGASQLEVSADAILAKANPIQEVADPTNDQDAETKKHVADNYLPLQTIGIADDNLLEVDDADAADNDYAKFTANGIEGRSPAEVMGDLSGQAAADFAMNTHKITGAVDPTANQDVATKAYVDDEVAKDTRIDPTPDSDHTGHGEIWPMTAGEDLVFGDACYVKSDGKLWKGDADAIATANVLFLALATISADAEGDFLHRGVARDDSWDWTVGGQIYLSCTAGALTQTAPSGTDDVIQILGIATHADRMIWAPTLVQVEHKGT